MKNNEVIARLVRLHSHMAMAAPDQVIALAHTLLFGQTPGKTDIANARIRLIDSRHVWVFPFLKSSLWTRFMDTDSFKQDEAENGRAAFKSLVAHIIGDAGGVLGFAEMTGRLVDQLAEGKDNVTASRESAPAEPEKPEEAASFKARLVKVEVDENGTILSMPDDIPADVRAAIERVAKECAASQRATLKA